MSYSSREFCSSSCEEKRRIIFLCFTLISLENFEFDYRENILRINIFFKKTDINKNLRIEEWNKVKFLMTSRSLNYLRGYV